MTRNPILRRLFREWELKRAIEANAYAIVFAGVLMGAFLPNVWLFLPVSVELYLLENAGEGWCSLIRTIYRIEDEGQVLKVRGGDFANLHQPSDEFATALAARCQ